ncbi:actin-like protein arp8 [Naganishia albida]|nr:actin-like protein arp8 [Naganishia albida]
MQSSKRKRTDPEIEVSMLSQTSFHLQPSLYVKGNQLSFAKTPDNQSVARKRADEADALRREEKRRTVDALLMAAAEAEAGRPVGPTAQEGLNGVARPAAGRGERMETDEVSAMDTRVPETQDAAFAQRLEETLESFPSRDPEMRQVPPLGVANEETIIIHPGSRYLKIGRGSDLTPISVPNCIFRKVHRPQADAEGIAPVGTSLPRTEGEGRMAEGSTSAEDSERDAVIVSLRVALRDRMRQEKLKLPAGKADQPILQVTRYNSTQKPIQYRPHNDPYGVDWLEDYSADVVFPERNVWVDEAAPYEVRWPVRGRTFNTVDYGENGRERLLGDVQEILGHALGKLNPPVAVKDLWKYSVALIVPDHTDKAYIDGMLTVLLQRMAFRQCGVLQESLCATFGAGLSSACVVDIGAERTSVACVDDGLLLGETRHILHFGRDDVTTFYTDLLRRVSFPYHELDLNRRLDWQMMDELTTRTCTLLDHLVAFNVWKIQVRRKGSPTTEYQLQTFDQTVLAPACFFDPRVFNWNAKMAKVVTRTISANHEDDTMPDLKDDGATLAMAKSTEHLLPPLPAPIPQDPVVTTTVDPETGEESTTTFQPEPIQPPAPAPTFDVVTEAGKMPIDFAVTNSLMAAGADLKTVNLANAILILGGGGLIEGISAALAWRVGRHFSGRITTNVTPEVLPPPRGLDPRYVTWRGGVVWTRLDAMNDIWIKRQEWDEIGMKAYRNRMY